MLWEHAFPSLQRGVGAGVLVCRVPSWWVLVLLPDPMSPARMLQGTHCSSFSSGFGSSACAVLSPWFAQNLGFRCVWACAHLWAVMGSGARGGGPGVPGKWLSCSAPPPSRCVLIGPVACPGEICEEPLLIHALSSVGACFWSGEAFRTRACFLVFPSGQAQGFPPAPEWGCGTAVLLSSPAHVSRVRMLDP